MIRARGLRFAYGRGREALKGVDLSVEPGLTLLVGPNGAGKSTLMRLLAGVEAPHQGTVEVDGQDLNLEEISARRSLAYVPDQPDLSPFATLREVMQMVERLRGAEGGSGEAALGSLGLQREAQRTIRELSTGQRRRAMLAAARIGSPSHLLLDEPLENLDAGIRPEVLSWIDGRVRAGATALIASHDVEPFLGRATALIGLRGGRAGAATDLPEDLTARRELVRSLPAC